ncbi:serine protease easter-like [Pollicipes pollicipes]|uniref:serine protease easter-like n=1 Tax=Pollicipes pollicipes TaxID=41117 RepID=UPI001884DD93|nr:serine protease easter-like [Pollicipes pollicipes]
MRRASRLALMLLAASCVSKPLAATGLSCRELYSPSQNAVVTLGMDAPLSDRSDCSGDLFRCSTVTQTCLNSPRACVGQCDAAACLPFGKVCDSVDDCAALAPTAGGASADEAHCSDILRTYRKTPLTSIDVGRFLAFQVSLRTCAAYCFFHESCSMFSYSVTGNRQCKIGCDDCGWRTLPHLQDNAVLYNATAMTGLLRSQLAATPAATPFSNPAGPSPLPAPGVCGQRQVLGPDTASFELASFGVLNGGGGGGPRVAARSEQRVVGAQGQHATYGEFPWMAQLQRLSGQPQRYKHHCGATIISARYLLTAAHCLQHAQRDYQATVGQFELHRLDGHEQTFAVQEMILHPNYMPGNGDLFQNDIAIIKLRTRGEGIVFSEKVQPLCVPSQPLAETEQPASCLVSVTSAVPLVSNGFCSSTDGYGSSFNGTRQLCAGELLGGVDSVRGRLRLEDREEMCSRESGPLACYSEAATPPHWYLAGVVSSGEGCGQPLRPGIYTRVAAYHDWIVRTLRYLESGRV